VSGFDIDVASSSANITRDCTYKIDVGNSATTPAHTSVDGLFHVIPAPVLTPTGAGAVTFSPAIATGGFGTTVNVTLPSINLTAAQVSFVQLVVSGGGSCGSGTVGKPDLSASGFGDLRARP